jgi:photosystem II stability/assembly factor-like uncharacterized protein
MTFGGNSSGAATKRKRAVPRARIGCLMAALLVAACPLSAQKWRMQYFYDKAKTELHIVDLQFPSTARGVAVGFIEENGKNRKSVALVTSDGGEHWQLVDLQEQPVSLFFLNETLGWMVTAKGGLWETNEAGRNWRKLPKPASEIVRVAFTSETDGWAIGGKKKVLETHDGGKRWTPVAAAAEPPGNPDRSAYTWIAFATPQAGIITGWNMPQRDNDQRFPDWLDPEEALARRDLPHLSYSLVTNDGGKTWKAESASLFGEIQRVRLTSSGRGLGLMVFSQGFRYPSEVYRIDWKTGKNETIFRDRQFFVSDVWLGDDGAAYLGGAKVVGQMRGIVPGKIQVLRSTDLVSWREMPVDYRAVANQVLFAAAGKSMWMATDNGMILKLEE